MRVKDGAIRGLLKGRFETFVLIDLNRNFA